jgi:predicted acylesterase/phospholipase RssA
VPQLRIALTLPGESSLGTYEAGAVCALLVAVQAVNDCEPDRVCIDVMAGSSSGALTAVLAARALLTGQDPVGPLRRAWVSEPTLRALRSGADRAPLSLDRAREVARDVLRAEFPMCGTAQSSPVALTFALGCLRGFSYRLGRQRHPGREPHSVTSFADWTRHDLDPAQAQGFTEPWEQAVDAAIASASHPLAFPAAILDRTEDVPGYQANGIANLPKSVPLELWYSDGGLLNRQPLGRCLDLVGEADRAAADAGDTRRLVLIVRTDGDRPPGPDDRSYADREQPPEWTATLARSLRLITTHSVYEDLRRAEKTNAHIAWLRELAGRLGALLDDGDPSVRRTLFDLLARIDADRSRMTPDCDREPLTGSHDVTELLERTLLAAAGVESKLEVDIEIVDGDPTKLAGVSLGRFGGFLAERVRSQDFLIGYGDMLSWMEREPGGLEWYGVPVELVRPACAAARERGATIPGWLGGRAGGRRPSLREGAQLVGLGVRAAGIGLRDHRRT